MRRRLLICGNNPITRIRNSFRDRVLADVGSFEAESCLDSSIMSLRNNGLFDKASLILNPNGYKASKLYSIIPSNGAGDFTFSRASAKRRRNSNGVLEALANDVPALEYPATGCPAWSFEPQRTNTVLQSQDFTNGWSANNANIVSNTHTAPDGTLTADTVNITGNSGFFRRLSISIANSTTYAMSCYFRNIGLTAGQTFRFYLNNNLGSPNSLTVFGTIDLAAMTITGSPSGATLVSATLTQVNSDWVRASIVFTTGSTTAASNCDIGFEAPIAPRSFVAWGVQLEVGSYATSYIPTTSASATRVADSAILSGASGLIGQTEGTLFADIQYNSAEPSARILAVSEVTIANRVVITIVSNRIQIIGSFGNSIFANIFPANTLVNGRNKIAFAYKSGDSVLYLNGVQIGTSTDSFSFTLPMNAVHVGCAESTGVASEISRHNVSAIYTNRLTNAELVALTT